jgi:hypothetical protein
VQFGGADALAAEHAGVRMGGRDCTERVGDVVLFRAEVGGDASLLTPARHMVPNEKAMRHVQNTQ